MAIISLNPWREITGIEINQTEGYEFIGPFHEWLRLRGVFDPNGPNQEKVVLFTEGCFRFWGGSGLARRDSQAPEIAGYRYAPERLYRLLWLGLLDNHQEVMLRMQSMCFNGMVVGAVTCDCGDQFELAKRMVAESWEKKGQPGLIIVAFHHIGKGFGLRNHALIDTMAERVAILRGQNPDPSQIDRWLEPFVELGGRPECDELEDMMAILRHFRIARIGLVSATNNPRKIRRLEQEGIRAAVVPLQVKTHHWNEFELRLKQKAGHLLKL